MVRIVNPFRGTDPIAKTISELGQNMFGGQLDRMVDTEKLVALQRGNQETDNLMGLVGEGGAASLASSPIAQAMIIGSGYKPEDFGKLGLLETATTKGAAAPATQNFQVGTGQSYDNTADAVGAKLAEVIRNNDMTSADRRYGVDQALVEAIVNGKPQYVPNVQAAGMAPVLSNTDVQGTFAQNNFGKMGDLPPAEQAYLGADLATGGKTPRNYKAPGGTMHITYDGVTDAQTGQVLPSGGYIAGVEGSATDALGLTTQSTNDDQGSVRRIEEYEVLSNELRTLATTQPDAFGLLGQIRGNLQEAVQVIPALNSLFGGQDLNTAASDMLQTYANNPAAAGMFAELASTYDTNLPTVRTLGVMLKYQLIAAALGQNGRDLSDKDLVQGEKLFPDPQGLFSSAQSTLATLDLFDRLMAGKKQEAMRRLNTGSISPQGGAAPPTAAAGAQPAATEEAQEGDTAVNPTTGERIQLVNGQWVRM